MSVYSKSFLFEECGFDWIPDDIDRDLLFNVSYDLGTGEVKLYILDESRRFLHKVSRDGITRQNKAQTDRDSVAPLSTFLGRRFNYLDVELDTVENDTFYLYIENTSRREYLRLLRTVCRRFEVDESRFIEVANRINETRVASLEECCDRRAVNGVKVPLTAGNCKVYSQPFKTGNGLRLSDEAVAFLTRVHECEAADLVARLNHMWVSSELHTDRVTLTTQYHQLVHRL